MAVTPFKTFVAGEVLTASDLNSSITTITNNGMSLWSPATASADFDGQKLILDADADTSITVDTDDRIDIEVAGTDSVTIGLASAGFVHIDPVAWTATADTNFGRLRVGNTRIATVPAGTTAIVASLYVEEPNLTATGTVTAAATLYIEDAPTEGTSNYALWVDNGATRLEGSLTATGAAILSSTVSVAGAMTVAGATTIANTLTVTNTATFSASVDTAARADVASATSATNIGAATTNYVRITGTATIVAFDTAGAGIWRNVVFGGALTLTHNATTLMLPGNANITTAAGDTALFISEGTGNWRCLSYVPDSGQSVIAASSDVTAFRTTHTADTALATQATGGTQIFATITNATIPTSGAIRVTIQKIELDETEGTAAAKFGIGIAVGTGATAWATFDTSAGTSTVFAIGRVDTSAASVIQGPSGWANDTNGTGPQPLTFSWDIQDNSFLTGARNILIYLGDNVESSTGEITVTGTTVTAVATVEVIDTT